MLGVATTVADAPSTNVPPPDVVPPSVGLEDVVTANCWEKLATRVLLETTVKLYERSVDC